MLASLWVGSTCVIQPRFSASRFWDVALEHGRRGQWQRGAITRGSQPENVGAIFEYESSEDRPALAHSRRFDQSPRTTHSGGGSGDLHRP